MQTAAGSRRARGTEGFRSLFLLFCQPSTVSSNDKSCLLAAETLASLQKCLKTNTQTYTHTKWLNPSLCGAARDVVVSEVGCFSCREGRERTLPNSGDVEDLDPSTGYVWSIVLHGCLGTALSFLENGT